MYKLLIGVGIHFVGLRARQCASRCRDLCTSSEGYITTAVNHNKESIIVAFGLAEHCSGLGYVQQYYAFDSQHSSEALGLYAKPSSQDLLMLIANGNVRQLLKDFYMLQANP